MSKSKGLVDDMNYSVGCWDVALHYCKQHVWIPHQDKVLISFESDLLSSIHPHVLALQNTVQFLSEDQVIFAHCVQDAARGLSCQCLERILSCRNEGSERAVLAQCKLTRLLEKANTSSEVSCLTALSVQLHNSFHEVSIATSAIANLLRAAAASW